MITYDELLIEADNNDLVTKEKQLLANKGRIKGNRIAISRTLTVVEKKCVLAEELGHYYTTVGNILDQSDTNNRKQETKARLWAYNKVLGLEGIVWAYHRGCHNLHEMAEELEVSEKFLEDMLERYSSKYGTSVKYGNYVIEFVPTLKVKAG